MVTFKSMQPAERSRLSDALFENAHHGKPILMSDKDTSFLKSIGEDEVTDEEVIAAIKSVPCHY